MRPFAAHQRRVSYLGLDPPHTICICGSDFLRWVRSRVSCVDSVEMRASRAASYTIDITTDVVDFIAFHRNDKIRYR